MQIKKMLKNWKVILLLVLLALAIITIHPVINAKGVAIRGVERNSSAELAGISSPMPTDKPVFREVIRRINGIEVTDIDKYNEITKTFNAGDSVIVETDTHYTKDNIGRTFSLFKKSKTYSLAVKPLTNTIYLNETEKKTIQESYAVNETVNNTIVEVTKTRNKTIEVQKTISEIIGVEDIGLTVYDAPSTNIKKGLDLEGGTRVLLQPAEAVNPDDYEIIIENLKQRLNVYGLSDIVVRKVGDLSGNSYIIVEIAGANEEEVNTLIQKQGKFEAKIGNNTMFVGGKDVKYVCRSGDCAFAVDPRKGCGQVGTGEYQCSFSFSITLSPESAQRQAEVTKDLQVIDNEYLSQDLDLYLDDEKVDTLKIGADLKGRPVTDISISGPGVGRTRQEAVIQSGRNMKRLQTILITGSLPVKLNIVKTDNISPLLGKEFVNNVLIMAVLAILSVAAVVLIRYRSLKISLPVVLTMTSEIILILGAAALIGWNLDLASIAGILVTLGTGVDSQIVIVDETVKGESSKTKNWKDRLKIAFTIIFSAYAITIASMIPLWSAGAGLLKGFALTTILGVTIGVFITRPAFAAIVEELLKE